jgi:hypothetical protein
VSKKKLKMGSVKVRSMVKRCPSCSSLSVELYPPILDRYICKDCSYIGNIMLEDDEFSEDDTELMEEDDHV